MNFPLSQFDQFFQENVLSRGYQYFKKGAVIELDWNEGQVFAEVLGSEAYQVKMVLEGGFVPFSSCSCPYEEGLCKHIAAVCYALLDQQESDEARKQFPGTRKRKSARQHARDVLDKLSLEELKVFFEHAVLEDRPLRDLFLLEFAHKDPGEDPIRFYRQSLEKLLREAEYKGNGFIDHVGSREVGKQSMAYLSLAEDQIGDRHDQNGIRLALLLIEKMGEALSNADDSDGYMLDSVRRSFSLLKALNPVDLEHAIRKECYSVCLQHYQNDFLKDYSMQWDFLAIAVHLAVDGEAFQEIQASMDQKTAPEFEEAKRFFQSQMANYRSQLLEKFDPDAVRNFLDQHLHIGEIREKRIHLHFEQEEYGKVQELAREGMEMDQASSSNLRRWQEWLLKAAIALEDSAEILHWAKALFSDSYANYYPLIKQYSPAEEWPRIQEELMTRMAREGINMQAEGNILLEEKMPERLLKRLFEQKKLQNLQHFQEALLPAYRKQVLDLYEVLIKDYLAFHTGRPHYKTASQYLLEIQKLEDHSRFKNLIEELRQSYPRRPSLLKELAKISPES